MKPHALIVDDSHYTVDLIRSIIDDEFEIVGTTGNGDEAIELYQEFLPDIVVMDLIITGVDGITATERIKSLDSGATVVILSTIDNVPKKQKAAEAGADGYISKPFEPEELLESMHQLAFT